LKNLRDGLDEDSENRSEYPIEEMTFVGFDEVTTQGN
jgi:hypothetical protein